MSVENLFLSDVEAFLERHEMPPTTFGKLALKDPTFVFKLRNGRDCRGSTERDVRGFMENYKPEKARAHA